MRLPRTLRHGDPLKGGRRARVGGEVKTGPATFCETDPLGGGEHGDARKQVDCSQYHREGNDMEQ